MGKIWTPRDIKPKDVPPVKVDPFWQISRDNLGFENITLAYDFRYLEAGTVQHPLGGVWDYMDILTDGAINPGNNFQTGTSGNSNLYIQFNDNERVFINREIYNLPIHGKQFFRYWNQVGAGQGATETVETGYRNLWFVCKKYPSLVRLKKHNPWACIVNTTVAPAASVFYWVGRNRPNASYILSIPWIPAGYKYFNFCFNTTATNYVCQTGQYSMCDDGLVNTTVHTKAVLYQTILATDRMYIKFTNNDGVDRTWQFNIIFTLKSDTM